MHIMIYITLKSVVMLDYPAIKKMKTSDRMM